MPGKMAYGTGENPPTANVSSASASYFSVFGVRPAVGRFYNEEEDGLDNAADVAVRPIIMARGPGNISSDQQVAVRLGGLAIIVLLIACANVRESVAGACCPQATRDCRSHGAWHHSRPAHAIARDRKRAACGWRCDRGARSRVVGRKALERSINAASLRALLRAEFPGAILEANTMADTMEPHYRPWQLGATLFTLFGALAALVAAIGIYSSVSYAVNQRTHEFGVRAALGADPRSIVTQVLGEGTRTVAVGVALGIVLAIVAGRLIASLLYGVSAGNPFAMAGAGVAMIVIAGLACMAPAWRAARSDPVAALRAE
jgi:hypothetical protein